MLGSPQDADLWSRATIRIIRANRRQRKQALALHRPSAVDAKRYVYVLQSETDGSCYYTGLTANVAARLAAHNAGRCPSHCFGSAVDGHRRRRIHGREARRTIRALLEIRFRLRLRKAAFPMISEQSDPQRGVARHTHAACREAVIRHVDLTDVGAIPEYPIEALRRERQASSRPE